MRILDRLLLWSFLKAYLICLVSLLSLYVVIDLFTNLEDFAQQTTGLVPVLQNIGKYYGYKVVQIFDRLCEAIVLLAATFTVAWIQRNNELVPLLSAGVGRAADNGFDLALLGNQAVEPVADAVDLLLGLGADVARALDLARTALDGILVGLPGAAELLGHLGDIAVGHETS